MSIVGTITNMAPEMINNASSYTEAVDIYSLGVTMWEIWTGAEPFSDKNQFQIYKLVGEEGRRPPLPDEMNGVYRSAIEKAWNQDPKRRVGATELLGMLRKEHERIINEVEERRINGLMVEERLPSGVPRCFKIMREGSLRSADKATGGHNNHHHHHHGHHHGNHHNNDDDQFNREPSLLRSLHTNSRTKALSSAIMKSGRNLMNRTKTNSSRNVAEGGGGGGKTGSNRTLTTEEQSGTTIRAESDVSEITMEDFEGFDDDENVQARRGSEIELKESKIKMTREDRIEEGLEEEEEEVLPPPPIPRPPKGPAPISAKPKPPTTPDKTIDLV